MVREKTKLVNFALSFSINDVEQTSFLKLYDRSITLTSMSDYLGVLRTSSASNMANLTKRISAHMGNFFPLLPSRLTLRHNASPASCLKIERLYAHPVLLESRTKSPMTKTPRTKSLLEKIPQDKIPQDRIPKDKIPQN